MKDRKRRLNIIEEPLMMVVADDDEYVGIGLREALAQHIELTLTARVTLVANIDRVLVLESLALAQLIKLLEVVRAGPECQLLVLAIHVSAQIPLMRRCRQERPMRSAKPKNNLSHE